MDGMSGETIAVLGVGVTLLVAILTFGFALLGAHRTTQATLNARMDRMDQRMDRMEQRFDRVEATLNDLRRDVTDIDRRLSRIEGAVLGAVAPPAAPGTGAAHRAAAGAGSAPGAGAGGRHRQPPAIDREGARMAANDTAAESIIRNPGNTGSTGNSSSR